MKIKKRLLKKLLTIVGIPAQTAAFQQRWGALALDNMRVIFTKLDRARFISHLDLMRCMQRAMKRSRIPIWYTEGFNPHAYLMFPLALSLGVSSRCEIMDFSLISPMPFEEIKARMNNALPDGLQVVSIDAQHHKHTEIAAAEYLVAMSCDLPSEEALARFESFLALEKIEVERLSKKKVLTRLDIKKDITLVSSDISVEKFSLCLRLPAGNQTNLNIGVVLEAFERLTDAKILESCIERTKILLADGEIFS